MEGDEDAIQGDADAGEGLEETAEESKKERNFGKTVLSVIWYLIYIAIMTKVTFSSVSSGAFLLSKMGEFNIYELESEVSGSIKSFKSTSLFTDVTPFLGKVIFPNFGPHDADDNSTKGFTRVGGPDSLTFVLGSVRLRQLRVINITCYADIYHRPITERSCNPTYSTAAENRKTLKLESKLGKIYSPAEELKSETYWGRVHSYSGGGYLVVLPTNATELHPLYMDLKGGKWIGPETRALIVEFAIYNPSLNTFGFVRMAWEFTQSGSVIPTWSIRSAQAKEYNLFDYSCEIIFIFFTVYFLIEEGISAKRMGWRRYLRSGWTYVTLIMFALSGIVIVINFQRYSASELASKIAVPNSTYAIPEVQEMTRPEAVFRQAAGCLLFLTFVKLFKYFKFSSNLSFLLQTLKMSAEHIGGVVAIFLTFLLAFTQLSHATLGTRGQIFMTIPSSFYTFCRFILGTPNYQEMYDADEVLGPLIFASFYLVVSILLINLFLAVMTESFHFMHDYVIGKKNETDHVPCKQSIICPCLKPAPEDTEEGIKPASNMKDIEIDPADLRAYLEGRGFTAVDIDIFMERFCILENRLLDGKEAHALLTDIINNTYIERNDEFGKVKKRETEEEEVIKQTTKAENNERIINVELELLSDRLNVVEGVAMNLFPKVEKLLAQLEADIDRNKRNSTDPAPGFSGSLLSQKPKFP